MIDLLMAAAAMTVGDLQTLCNDTRAVSECSIYVLGIGQGAALEAEMTHDRTRFCLPDDVSETELGAVVERFVNADLARFPQDKGLAAAGFAGAALLKQYPCPDN